MLIINGKKHDINRIVYSKKLHLRIGIDLTQLWGWNVISHSFSESAISAKSYSFFFFLYQLTIFLIISQIYTTILFTQNNDLKKINFEISTLILSNSPKPEQHRQYKYHHQCPEKIHVQISGNRLFHFFEHFRMRKGTKQFWQQKNQINENQYVET